MPGSRNLRKDKVSVWVFVISQGAVHGLPPLEQNQPKTKVGNPSLNSSSICFSLLCGNFSQLVEILKYFFIVCSYCSLDSIGAHSTTARNENLLRAFTIASSSLKEMFSFERQTHDLKYMGRLRKLNSQEKKIGWQ